MPELTRDAMMAPLDPPPESKTVCSSSSHQQNNLVVEDMEYQARNQRGVFSSVNVLLTILPLCCSNALTRGPWKMETSSPPRASTNIAYKSPRQRIRRLVPLRSQPASIGSLSCTTCQYASRRRCVDSLCMPHERTHFSTRSQTQSSHNIAVLLTLVYQSWSV